MSCVKTSKIKLIIGLGNPGKAYEKTRHNAGEWFVRQLLPEKIVLKPEKKFKGLTAKVELWGNTYYVLIPTTFMNESGESVLAFSKFYKIKPPQILIAHDELSLPIGTVRFKSGGGHAGHNGLRDIITLLGSNEFLRTRIGIGHPGHKDYVTDYVLNRATKGERQLIDESISEAISVLPHVLNGELEKAMTKLHTGI